MKLYFSPGACSLSSHIALLEAGLDFSLVRVDLRTKRTGDDRDFTAINPKGYVPALELNDGAVLTEGPAIMQFVADRAPERQLAPANGTLERYRLIEWLNFISTELHKNFSPLFRSTSSDDAKQAARIILATRLDWVAAQLARQDYLLGSHFSIADGYLFTVLRWTRHLQFDLSPWPALASFTERVAARPAVQQALRAEGLTS